MAAREDVYKAKQEMREARLVSARKLFESAWQKWAGIVAEHEVLVNRLTEDDLVEDVQAYVQLLEQLDEELPEDFVLHNFDTTIRGRDAWIDAVVRPSFAAFPDLSFTAEIILAEDDKVAIRWRAQGTNDGPFQGHPASGKRVSFTGAIIYRVEQNRIVEAWAQPDRLGLMQQMGLD